ncbi:hypothetical protein [Burkholderia vietnamiensis]|uniref:hypothetical protein n=2 Tax=Burkholderia vietnamiensis TaxID=60552 RepID=UPI001B909F6F|nr:hypothetical protein [Burkholderia vietnamiensis]MBR8216863.1 hypothetical protein [Burkholderia vietnamiensis]HDR9108754.1 hypothetical protein [Burkholderia vietnamiensis]
MQALPSRLAAAQRRRLAMCGGNRGMRASGREASMRPESRVSRGEAEKTKGRENQSPGPSFNMVRLQEWYLRLNQLIQIEIASDKYPIHPQTYPHTSRDLRERPHGAYVYASGVNVMHTPTVENSGTMVSLTPDEIAKLKTTAVRERPYAPRISIALAVRLLDKSDRYFDPFAVLDELDYLEGIRPTSKTKRESPFKGPHLQPFWHKHFSSARHLVQNIGIRWNLADGGNRDLDRMLREVVETYGEDPELWQAYLTHRLVVGGFEERAQRGLTGDWIIYAKHDGANYYLDLATHEEGELEHAEQLSKKLRDGCFAEFPFVFP